MNPYDTLGIPRTASKEDAKKAFRKLAMQFHPDRLADKSDAEKKEGEAKFKKYKEALEQIENPVTEKPGAGFGFYGNTDSMEDIFKAFQEVHRQQQKTVRTTVSLNLKAAFEGTRVPLNVGSTSIAFAVPAGVPHKAIIEDQVPTESGQRRVIISFDIKDPNFSFKHDPEDGFLRGDLETTVDVPALTLLLGGYIVVEDFLGAKLQVRVPAGFNPKHTLKVSKRGYAGWHNPRGARQAGVTRGDLYVNVNPIRTTIPEMTMDEHQALEQAIKDYYKSVTTQPLDERV